MKDGAAASMTPQQARQPGSAAGEELERGKRTLGPQRPGGRVRKKSLAGSETSSSSIEQNQDTLKGWKEDVKSDRVGREEDT